MAGDSRRRTIIKANVSDRTESPAILAIPRMRPRCKKLKKEREREKTRRRRNQVQALEKWLIKLLREQGRWLSTNYTGQASGRCYYCYSPADGGTPHASLCRESVSFFLSCFTSKGFRLLSSATRWFKKNPPRCSWSSTRGADELNEKHRRQI